MTEIPSPQSAPQTGSGADRSVLLNLPLHTPLAPLKGELSVASANLSAPELPEGRGKGDCLLPSGERVMGFRMDIILEDISSLITLWASMRQPSQSRPHAILSAIARPAAAGRTRRERNEQDTSTYYL